MKKVKVLEMKIINSRCRVICNCSIILGKEQIMAHIIELRERQSFSKPNTQKYQEEVTIKNTKESK
jgi:hypothetical protein